MTTATRNVPTSRPPQSTGGLVSALKSPAAARILFPITVLAFWYAAIGVVRAVWPFAVDVLPLPQEVVGVMWDELRAPFVDDVRPLSRVDVFTTFGRSLFRLGTGFLIALVVGTGLGIAMGLSKAWDAFWHDWIMAILAMPALGWALFLSLVFGFGSTGPILTVILAGIPFVIVNVREGVRNTPRELFDMAQAFGVDRAGTIRHVLIPSMMPYFFAAIRYAFSIGWKGLVISEVFGGQDGAGWTIKFWYDAHRAHGVVGYALFFVIFAILLEKLVFERMSRRVFRWRPDASGREVVEQAFEAPGMGGTMGTATLMIESEVEGFLEEFEAEDQGGGHG